MELTKEYFDRQLANLAAKADLEQFADKGDLEQLHQEFRGVKTDITEMKQILTDLNNRDKEDSNAFAKTFVKHDNRLTVLENEVKKLKLNRI